jgi:hypothetical protein
MSDEVNGGDTDPAVKAAVAQLERRARDDEAAQAIAARVVKLFGRTSSTSAAVRAGIAFYRQESERRSEGEVDDDSEG